MEEALFDDSDVDDPDGTHASVEPDLPSPPNERSPKADEKRKDKRKSQKQARKRNRR